MPGQLLCSTGCYVDSALRPETGNGLRIAVIAIRYMVEMSGFYTALPKNIK